MNIVELIILSISLAMDACAVSMCKGMVTNKLRISNVLEISICFGLFQAIMPMLGYLLGTIFKQYILNIDHWISFILLSVLGINMILDSKKQNKENDNFDIKTILFLSVATSIDAFAVGVTLAFLNVNMLLSITIIGILTCMIVSMGYIVGYIIGDKLKSKAGIIGGIILILMSLKILLNHLCII